MSDDLDVAQGERARAAIDLLIATCPDDVLIEAGEGPRTGWQVHTTGPGGVPARWWVLRAAGTPIIAGVLDPEAVLHGFDCTDDPGPGSGWVRLGPLGAAVIPAIYLDGRASDESRAMTDEALAKWLSAGE